MKIIKIFQENTPTIELFDDDSSDRLEYAMLLKEILRSTDVKVVETTSGCVILRSSEIKSILITDKLEEYSNRETNNEIEKSTNEFSENVNQEEDFIGDQDKNV